MEPLIKNLPHARPFPLKDQVGYEPGKVVSLTLAQKPGVEMPICRCVYEILYRQRPVQEVARELMGRARKGEIEDGWRYPVG